MKYLLIWSGWKNLSMCTIGHSSNVCHLKLRLCLCLWQPSLVLYIIYYIFDHSCKFNNFSLILPKLVSSVSDPLHFDAESDPDPRIRFRDDGSGSGTGSGSDLNSNNFKFFSSYFISVKGLKRITMCFLLL